MTGSFQYCYSILKIFRELITSFIKNNGTPNLVHVHVAMWVGIVALWLKRENGIPYIVTEHWTGYDKNAIENIYNKGWFFKYLSGVILKHAGLIVAR
ncbi:MAG: glycosyltransferase [Segetibacter sp.]